MPQDIPPRRDFESLHPIVRAAVERVSAQLAEEKIPIGVFETYRVPQRQRQLFAKGGVTGSKAWRSYHQYGLAADFVLFLDGKWRWDTGGRLDRYWARMHEIGREHGLEPLSWEKPHLQCVGLDIDDLQAGRYPAGGDASWAENLAATIVGWAGPGTPRPPETQDRPASPDGLPGGDDGDDDGDDVFSLLAAPSLVVREQPDRGLTTGVILAAQGCEQQWGVPTCITLAQFVLESGGGRRMPPGSNNPFGIKALRDEPFVLAMTREFEGGAWRRREARFRKFASFDEAFAHHARLLATAPVYRPAMRNKDDPVAFARALTGVYATDPDYGTKLVQLIEQLDLRLYDVAGAALAPDSAPGVIFPPPISMPLGRLALQLGARGENVTALQLALKQAGYGVGAVDGLFGTLTRAALLAFQADNGLPATGAADGATMARLNDAPQRPLDRDRLMATEEELRLKGSETMIEARRTRMLGLVTTILGALGIGNSVVVNTVGAAPVAATAQPVEDFLARVTTTLAGQPEPDQLQALARSAGDILAGLRAGASPELSRLATQVLDALPADAAARFPEVETLLRAAATTPAAQSVPRTVFDLLPGMVAPGHNLEAIVGGVASLASSLVPGLGGSIGALAIGLLARHFANRVTASRLQDHRDATNVNR